MTTGIDFLHWATHLDVVPVYERLNVTGWQTPRVLYDPNAKADDGQSYAPRFTGYAWFADHGTVGRNTLRFWGERGSVNNRTWSLAQYLLPHEKTTYADGRERDTTYAVFKMVPDGFSCNSMGVCIGTVQNGNTLSVEYESLQNGVHDIDMSQYIKGALLYANAAATYRIRDYARVPHGLVATNNWGRRTDPWAGKLDIALSWQMVQEIRADVRIWQFWNLPQPQRGL